MGHHPRPVIREPVPTRIPEPVGQGGLRAKMDHHSVWTWTLEPLGFDGEAKLLDPWSASFDKQRHLMSSYRTILADFSSF